MNLLHLLIILVIKVAIKEADGHIFGGPTITKCKVNVDVGFILDSSGSLRREYHKEKEFLKSLAGSFGISKHGSHAGVVTFSTFAKHSIKMKDHTDIDSFNAAVDAIPIMGFITMIDRALRKAQEELFAVENGAREGTRKILVLLTDGSQTKYDGWVDPAKLTNELRKSGVTVIVVGIGRKIKQTELDNMAGGAGEAFNADSFDKLISKDFIGKLTEVTCFAAMTPLCVLDVGFILDSSGSLTNHYRKEKEVLKSFVKSFGISKFGSHAGVVTFSNDVAHSIKLKDHTNIQSFNAAVDAIPFMGAITRIDKALRLAQQVLFALQNGARYYTRKVLVLLTDGGQTLSAGRESPIDISNELRKANVTLIVVGTGSEMNIRELDHIAGGPGQALSAAAFKKLFGKSEYIIKLAGGNCIA